MVVIHYFFDPYWIGNDTERRRNRGCEEKMVDERGLGDDDSPRTIRSTSIQMTPDGTPIVIDVSCRD